jgi:hypothetical protein
MSVYQYVTRKELENVVTLIARDIKALEEKLTELSFVVMELQIKEEIE